MRELRLTGRPPALYIVLALVCAALIAAVAPTPAWPVGVAAGALVVTFGVLALRAATVRFAFELQPEPLLELGSVFGRTRTPLSAIAAVRRRSAGGGYGPGYDIWEAMAADGTRLAGAADLGLSHEAMRELETQLRLFRIPLERV